ncbi:hypothetical protein SRHO_G00096800 [Serrasalmus rhombeus]
MVDPKTRSSDGGAAKQAKSLPPPAPTTRPGLLFKTSGTLNGKHDDVEKLSSCCFRHVAHLAEKSGNANGSDFRRPNSRDERSLLAHSEAQRRSCRRTRGPQRGCSSLHRRKAVQVSQGKRHRKSSDTPRGTALTCSSGDPPVSLPASGARRAEPGDLSQSGAPNEERAPGAPPDWPVRVLQAS